MAMLTQETLKLATDPMLQVATEIENMRNALDPKSVEVSLLGSWATRIRRHIKLVRDLLEAEMDNSPQNRNQAYEKRTLWSALKSTAQAIAVVATITTGIANAPNAIDVMQNSYAEAATTVYEVVVDLGGSMTEAIDQTPKNNLASLIMMATDSIDTSHPTVFHITDPVGKGLEVLWSANKHSAGEAVEELVSRFESKYDLNTILAGIRFGIVDSDVSSALIEYWENNRANF